MKIPEKIKGRLARLGIAVLFCLLVALILFPLRIYHSTLFNSGVSGIIFILALVWIVYSVSDWITEGGKE